MSENKYCAKCSESLFNRDGSIRPTGESGIYNPNGPSILLCEYCFDAEDDLIEQKGTNDLPDVLARYKENIARTG